MPYTGSCSCVEGYKACYEPVDSSGTACLPFCPVSRLAACVAPDASCPGVPPSEELPKNLDDEPVIESEVHEEPGSPATANGDFMSALETLLSGENPRSLSPGWAAIASLAAAMLMGIWILINVLPNLTFDDIRSAFEGWGTKDAPSSPGLQTSSVLINTYNSNPANFRQCQDMVYAKLWGHAPPTAVGQGKALIFEKMKAEGYWQADQGGMYDPPGLATRLGQLRDGDIIMFDRNGLPTEQDANHYAVVADGKIYEILNLPKGGEMNITDVKDVRSYFGKRTYTSKVTGKTYSPTAYYGYRVFRK